MNTAELNQLRQQIDNVDNDIITLLDQRMQLALETNRYKSEHAQDVLDPAREKNIIDRLLRLETQYVSAQGLVRIFQTIMQESKNLQRQHQCKLFNKTVSVMGDQGSFSEAACYQYFCLQNADQANLRYAITSMGVINDLRTGLADYGVLALNNSNAGIVGETIAALTNASCVIVDTLALAIHHSILSIDGNTHISDIYSHEQALQQCQHYLQQHHPHATLHAIDDTAIAARKLSQGTFIQHSCGYCQSTLCTSL